MAVGLKEGVKLLAECIFFKIEDVSYYCLVEVRVRDYLLCLGATIRSLLIPQDKHR